MKKIVVIEDQPQMRRNVATILEMEGFEVATAEDGRRGVEMVRTVKPDLIICDVMMPDIDGYGVIKALRSEKETASIPFIFLTAKGEKNDQRAGMNLGADDYLTKPVARDDLLAAIAARLERQEIHESRVREQVGKAGFNPNFRSPVPLESLGLTPREAEVLLWVAQGKSNADVGTICAMAEKTVKKHLGNIFEKLGVESRNAATLCALEVLSSPQAQSRETPPG
jgi:DNA-binding NarL/FixJ family response regulator